MCRLPCRQGIQYKKSTVNCRRTRTTFRSRLLGYNCVRHSANVPPTCTDHCFGSVQTVCRLSTTTAPATISAVSWDRALCIRPSASPLLRLTPVSRSAVSLCMPLAASSRLVTRLRRADPHEALHVATRAPKGSPVDLQPALRALVHCGVNARLDDLIQIFRQSPLRQVGALARKVVELDKQV